MTQHIANICELKVNVHVVWKLQTDVLIMLLKTSDRHFYVYEVK